MPRRLRYAFQVINHFQTHFSVARDTDKPPTARAHLAWTFPLSHAELVGGDGTTVYRQRIDLSQTKGFGELDFTTALPATFVACRWLRLEVWDVATNGAYTQPLPLKAN